MGGCRCTYRNCTIRTDGTTHMFHYPVFDKVRCHQWLTNAQKHEFLNLKVSQLKNRVICQHHFKNEYFMNFKKDKLTFEAVPTLDGPFCDPGQYADIEISQDDTKIYPISLYDIETEYLTLYEKKANFSVKYGDFLTNCDLMDMGSFNLVSNGKTQLSNKDKQKRVKNGEELQNIKLKDNVDKLPDSTTLNVLPNKSSIIPEDTQTQLEALIPAGFTFIQPNILEYDEINCNKNDQCEKSSKNNNNDETQVTQKEINLTNHTKKDMPQERRVKIISEKKISEPLPLAGKLEPVSPSLILRLPDKRNKKKAPNNITKSKKKDDIKEAYINILNNNGENMLSKKEVPVTKIKEKDENKTGCTNILNNTTKNISQSNEVPVIIVKEQEDKRARYTNISYNNTENVLSSKEIIVSKTRKKDQNKAAFENTVNNNTEKIGKDTFPISRSSKEVTVTNNQKQSNKNYVQANQKVLKNKESNEILSQKSLLKPKINQVRVDAIKEKRKFNMKLRDIIESCLDKMDDQDSGQLDTTKNEQVGTFLSKDSALPSRQEYTIACLDARIKRMEDVLLNKIDQNTQRIIELKNSVLTSAKKSAFTQTTNNEESHKKELYKEISKYLSQNANCLIYEELFMNKYTQSSSQNLPSPKRRKRR